MAGIKGPRMQAQSIGHQHHNVGPFSLLETLSTLPFSTSFKQFCFALKDWRFASDEQLLFNKTFFLCFAFVDES